MENKKTNTLIHSSEPRYSEFHAIDGSRVTISYRLGVMERSLPDDTFIRVHQSFILNWHYIDTFVGNSVKIGDRWFPIGRAYRPRLLQVLHFPELPRQNSKQEL